MAKLSEVRIKQGTTPVITVVVDDQDLQDATVYLSIRSRNILIVKSNYKDNGDIVLTPVYDEEDPTQQIGTQIEAQLSQRETLCLEPGLSRIEAGWIYEDGSADKSNIGVLSVDPSLYKWVMQYGENTH